MIFFSISNPRLKSSPGKVPLVSKKFTYVLSVDENKRQFLKKSGETDIFEEVQMFKEECNIYNILRKYQYGDVSVLSRCSGSYIDTIGQPKTMQEALNLSIKLKSNFDNLKPEIRQEFNGDFNVFLKSVADGSLSSILEKFNEPVKEVSVDE